MIIAESELRQIIRSELLRENDQEAVRAVIIFYPGIDIGLQSVADYVRSYAPGEDSIVNGHSFIRPRENPSILFVIPNLPRSSFSGVESSIKNEIGEPAYDVARKYLGGYSAGSAGVKNATSGDTSFNYVYLADPTPTNVPTRLDKLTYTPENWGSKWPAWKWEKIISVAGRGAVYLKRPDDAGWKEHHQQHMELAVSFLYNEASI